MKPYDIGNNANMQINIGEFKANLEELLNSLDNMNFASRLAAKDPYLWAQSDSDVQTITNRLGWLDAPERMTPRLTEIKSIVRSIIADGFKDAVLMGMGGSSLSPEVSRLTFGIAPGYLNLYVLDTTDPCTISNIENAIDLSHTLFIVSTKSGTTIETVSAYKYFFDRVSKKNPSNPGGQFIAITDPGTPLVKESHNKRFRHLFENFPDIGGRYSALSYFGLVPAALIGADIDDLIARSKMMMLGSSTKASENESVVLGATIAALAQAGRDKLTLLLSPEISAFGYWIEQLVAESTGKMGKGIIPVEGEPLDSIVKYGKDRQFVYIRLEGGNNLSADQMASVLARAGHPIVTINLSDKFDIGREYMRWEIATATACSIIGVNAFDEPNVKESKDNTNELINGFNRTGNLPTQTPSLVDGDISIFGAMAKEDLFGSLTQFIDQYQEGDYFALTAFLPYSNGIYKILQDIRSSIGNTYKAAVTLGYGPRYLHSTGQLHKGGPNSGIFIQFTADDKLDLQIPGENYTFGILKRAQADGDMRALQNKNRRFLRIDLGANINNNLQKISEMLRESNENEGFRRG